MYVTVGSASLPANVKISPRMGSFVDPNSWNLDPDTDFWSSMDPDPQHCRWIIIA